MSNRKVGGRVAIKPLAFIVGAGLAVSLASMPIANASINPFTADNLSSGYNLASGHMDNPDKTNGNTASGDKAKDGKCGAGKCGGDKKGGDKAKDGKCGAGKCGGDK